jgi:hypothetical protein
MKRTQIYLEEGIFELLRQQSKVEKKTISQIIREAIEAHLGTRVARIQNHSDRVTGIRNDQNNDVNEYIRSLRQDRQR